MAALVVLMLVCIAFGFYQKHSARNAPPKQQEQATPMLSGRTLTLPPLSQIQPPEPQPAPVVMKLSPNLKKSPVLFKSHLQYR